MTLPCLPVKNTSEKHPLSCSLFRMRLTVAFDMPQCKAKRQRVAGGVAEEDHRLQLQSLHLTVVVDGMYP